MSKYHVICEVAKYSNSLSKESTDIDWIFLKLNTLCFKCVIMILTYTCILRLSVQLRVSVAW